MISTEEPTRADPEGKDCDVSIIVTHTIPIVGQRPSACEPKASSSSGWNKSTPLYRRWGDANTAAHPSPEMSDNLQTLWQHYTPQLDHSSLTSKKMGGGHDSCSYFDTQRRFNLRLFEVGGGVVTFHTEETNTSLSDLLSTVRDLRLQWSNSIHDPNDKDSASLQIRNEVRELVKSATGGDPFSSSGGGILWEDADKQPDQKATDADYATVFAFLRGREDNKALNREAVNALLRATANLVGDKDDVAQTRVRANFCPNPLNNCEPGFGYDKRIRMFAGRRGAAVMIRVPECGKFDSKQFPSEVIGSFLNLVEIMWHRLFMLVWLGRQLDDTLSRIARASGEPEKGRNLEGAREVHEILLNVRQTYFGLLQDPTCYLFEGGSVTNVADWYLDKFWIRRQEGLIKDKLDMLDQVLASQQVVRALSAMK